MKKLLSYFSTILVVTILLSAGCKTETTISEHELPEQAKLFLTSHFSGQPIIKATRDNEGNTTTFEVILANSINVDFDQNGKCISMDGHGQKLPDSTFPSGILTYVQTHYSDHFITDWGLESFGQKVELSNEIELAFDLSGHFLRILD